MPEIVFADKNAEIAHQVVKRIQEITGQLVIERRYHPEANATTLIPLPQEKTLSQQYAVLLIPGLVVKYFPHGNSVLLNETTLSIWKEFFPND